MKIIIILLLIGAAVGSPRTVRQVGAQSGVAVQNQQNNLAGLGVVLALIQQLLGLNINQVIAGVQANLPINAAIGNSGSSSASSSPTQTSGGSSSGLGGSLSLSDLLNIFGRAPQRASYSPTALKCEPVESPVAKVLAEATNAFQYPIRTRKLENNVTQTTYGYTINGDTIIHSVLEGNSTTMKDFVNDHKKRLTKKSKAKTQSRSANEISDEEELEDEALAEYGLRSLTNLAKSMMKSATDNEKVTKSLDCQVDSFECTLEARESPDEVINCSEKLCSCLAQIFA